MGISQERREVGHAFGKMGRRGGRLDTEFVVGPGSEGRRHYCPTKLVRRPTAHLRQKASVKRRSVAVWAGHDFENTTKELTLGREGDQRPN